MKKKILVAYSTQDGQTRKIADAIAGEASRLGFDARIANVEGPAWEFHAGTWDGVIVGAPVHLSRFPKLFRRRIRAAAPHLARVPTAFFSVCLGILERDNPKTQAAEREIVRQFEAETEFRPQAVAIFAGAILYSRYGWLKRRILRSIARKAGTETSFDRDYEFTDWSEVARFTRDFLARIEPGLRDRPAPAISGAREAAARSSG
jgi:menaquinone-dependent protoporphyrinogen oxidase